MLCIACTVLRVSDNFWEGIIIIVHVLLASAENLVLRCETEREQTHHHHRLLYYSEFTRDFFVLLKTIGSLRNSDLTYVFLIIIIISIFLEREREK